MPARPISVANRAIGRLNSGWSNDGSALAGGFDLPALSVLVLEKQSQRNAQFGRQLSCLFLPDH